MLVPQNHNLMMGKQKMSKILELKIVEMIALGVAYGINCKICMEYHKKLAVKAGVSEKEMHAAIQVAEGVTSGAANKTKGYAKDLFGEITEEGCCAEGSECCP